MGSIEIVRTETVNASADRLWKILAEDFAVVASWASTVDSSNVHADDVVQTDGAPSGRVCEVRGFGSTDERFTRYDAASRSFAYSVDAGKMPGFVKDMQVGWSIVPDGARRARVTTTMSANATGVMGAVMGLMMKMKFSSTVETTLNDLKVYAETGRPSPAKNKS